MLVTRGPAVGLGPTIFTPQSRRWVGVSKTAYAILRGLTSKAMRRMILSFITPVGFRMSPNSSAPRAIPVCARSLLHDAPSHWSLAVLAPIRRAVPQCLARPHLGVRQISRISEFEIRSRIREQSGAGAGRETAHGEKWD